MTKKKKSTSNIRTIRISKELVAIIDFLTNEIKYNVEKNLLRDMQKFYIDTHNRNIVIASQMGIITYYLQNEEFLKNMNLDKHLLNNLFNQLKYSMRLIDSKLIDGNTYD